MKYKKKKMNSLKREINYKYQYIKKTDEKSELISFYDEKILLE